MSESHKFVAGDRVEQMCVTCGEERGHVIVSIAKNGRISRVSCPICGSRVPYKSGASAARSQTGAPYDQKRTYRKGQFLTHPTFGVGEVTAIIEPCKMDVLFADKIRRMIHAH